jgi:chemotaxis signal transduction protein
VIGRQPSRLKAAVHRVHGWKEKIRMAMLEMTMYKTEADCNQYRVQQGKFITFRVEDTCYAVDAKYVRELICSVMVTLIKSDDNSRYLPMINFRGKLVRAFDMQKMTGRRRKNASMIPGVLMIEQKTGGGKMAGLIVDSVEEVIQSGDRQWSECSAAAAAGNMLISAEVLRGERRIHLLNPEFLFDTEMKDQGSS